MILQDKNQLMVIVRTWLHPAGEVSALTMGPLLRARLTGASSITNMNPLPPCTRS
jgi:hypothetical protein